MTQDHITVPLGKPTGRRIAAWYDTREGLEGRLKAGLEGLREIARARHEAGYDRGQRMAEWCILGMFWADTCGNVSLITEGAPRDGYNYWGMEGVYQTPPVMDPTETRRFSSHWTVATGTPLPPEGARCDRCGRGWGLDNVRDYYDEPPRHRRCQELFVIERERKEIKGILDRSEIPYTEMVMIPNEYHSDPDPTYYGPWFVVETSAGRIKIGWRKRVIHIDWSETGLEVSGAEVVEDPNVTHGPGYAHAWGPDKAVECLRRLWSRGSRGSESLGSGRVDP